MPFAIHLFFDENTEAAINLIWKRLADTEIAPYLYRSANRPHITLAIFQQLDLAECKHRLKAIAATTPALPLCFQYLGVFPTTGAIFAGPTVTNALLDFHHAIHETLQPIGAAPNSYYLPENWIPHCGLAMELASEAIAPAFEICLGLPLHLNGKIVEISCVEFRPIRIHFSFNLNSVDQKDNRSS